MARMDVQAIGGVTKVTKVVLMAMVSGKPAERFRLVQY
jgi:hypothetical protein